MTWRANLLFPPLSLSSSLLRSRPCRRAAPSRPRCRTAPSRPPAAAIPATTPLPLIPRRPPAPPSRRSLSSQLSPHSLSPPRSLRPHQACLLYLNACTNTLVRRVTPLQLRRAPRANVPLRHGAPLASPPRICAHGATQGRQGGGVRDLVRADGAFPSSSALPRCHELTPAAYISTETA